MPGLKSISYGLARRPVQQGAGRDRWSSQVCPDHAYWLRKKQVRKYRKTNKVNSPQKKESPKTSKRNFDFNILQANVAGIKNKRTELQKLFHDRNVHVAILQETQHQSCNYTISGYVAHACSCNSCRGIITYVRKDLQCNTTQHTTDSPNDILSSTVWFGDKMFQIYNIYSPPKEIFTFTCNTTLFKSTILAGDFNGHSPLWGYQDRNRTGTNIEDLCQSTNLIRIQDEHSTPTLLHKVHSTRHRPDLTLVSADIHSKCRTEVLKDIASDHLPTLISFDMGKRQSRKRKSRWNFKKANWAHFQTELDLHLDLDTISNLHVEEANSHITDAILKASKSSIPRGCMKNYSPFWNDQLQTSVDKRQQARRKYEQNPSVENRVEYNKAAAETKLLTKQLKKQAWTDKCSNLNLQQGGRDAWKLLNNISGERNQENPKPFKTDTEVLTTDSKKAEHLNKYFAKVTKAARKTDLDRGLKKALQEEEKRTTTPVPEIFSSEFTSAELDKAISLLKLRKSPGPDRIHNEMIKNTSQKGKKALLILYNKTWVSGDVPKAWKTATITPILKKGKTADQPKNYRPISQTSCLGKVAERMVNRRLYWWMETNGLITQTQAGFRRQCRTEDQLFRFTQKVLDGFQEGKQTTAVFIDLQQAYDRVWRTGLFQKMQSLGIKSNLYSWIKSFLSDRLIQTRFNSALSSKQTQEEGLPQGSSLSCTLFLIFLNDVSDILDAEKALFADDLVIWHTSNSTIISQRRLQDDLKRLEEYCNYWKLKVNETKSVYSIFTRSHKDAKKRLNLTVNGSSLSREDNPTYLGVTLDRQLTLNQHMENIRKKADKRLNLVKHLASSNWGADKNTLRSLYLGYTRSIMDYNIVLQNMCSKTTKQSLDRVQNQALRLICGGMRSSPIAACEISANVEPLEKRRKKAALELYERAKRMEPSHPCKSLVDNWKGLSRLQQKSVLHVVEDLKTKHHLPENRKPLQKVIREIPPHRNMKSPTIRKTLLGKETKKSDPISLKASALETIDQYPKEWIHIYTDGSAFKATVNAGYGATINYPNGDKDKIHSPCGSFCSNFVAEREAITEVLKHVTNTFDRTRDEIKDIVIFTDSLSALQALESGEMDNQEISKLTIACDHLMNRHSINVTLQWIPGHLGIKGNEEADVLAKRGAGQPQPEVPVTYDTVCKIIRSNLKEEWLNDWTNNSTGRALYEHMNAPRPKDPINTLRRDEQALIFRLRTKHVPLNNHLNRIKKDHSSQCPLCRAPNETVEHHLFDCTQLMGLRGDFLPDQPTIGNTLYCDSEQLRATCKFYRQASCLRAAAQRQLVG